MYGAQTHTFTSMLICLHLSNAISSYWFPQHHWVHTSLSHFHICDSLLWPVLTQLLFNDWSHILPTTSSKYWKREGGKRKLNLKKFFCTSTKIKTIEKNIVKISLPSTSFQSWSCPQLTSIIISLLYMQAGIKIFFISPLFHSKYSWHPFYLSIYLGDLSVSVHKKWPHPFCSCIVFLWLIHTSFNLI